MRAIAVAILFCLFHPMAPSEDKPRVTLLPAETLAKGTVQLFDGSTSFGWKLSGDAAADDNGLSVPQGGQATYGVELPNGTLGITWGDGTTQDIPWTGGELQLPLKALSAPLVLKAITFTPDAGRPLFNGKDLSGWKVFSGNKDRMKSEFKVTDDGDLRILNGAGTIATEADYGDFLLQLEFKTNGDGLNSGVFFRCIPDEYLNGYEVQIHNVHATGDPTKPTDGGTGAIYRRQVARRVLSKDREWTHLCIVARGDTIATWVNGYPMAHWVDDRPANANPRQGKRTEAGRISLQGHDPTTDVLFRNLRLLEYPTK